MTTTAEWPTVDDIISRGRDLCYDIAGRDLGDHPLYIIPQSTIAGDFGQAGGCQGYTSSSLDLYLREHIGRNWRGRGPCIVVNDLAIRDVEDREDVSAILQTIILHELAHILGRPVMVPPRPELENNPDRVKYESLSVAYHTARDDEPPAHVPLYQGHEASFIRIALHLRYRAIQRGFWIWTPCMCAGEMYGLSPMHRYVRALGDEPQQLDGGLLRVIEKLPPPQAFTDLWQADVQAYQQSLTPKETE